MRTWACVAAVGLAAGPAAAFYFPGWPADGLPRPRTLYGPEVRLPDVGPLSDARNTPLPGASERTRIVPEPSGLVLAAAGLAVLRRRLGSPAACTGGRPPPPAAAGPR